MLFGLVITKRGVYTGDCWESGIRVSAWLTVQRWRNTLFERVGEICLPSFLSRAEINIRPWEILLKNLEEGNKRSKWLDREPYAYWKGNPTIAEHRQELMTCNVSDQYDWYARLYAQVLLPNYLHLILLLFQFYLWEQKYRIWHFSWKMNIGLVSGSTGRVQAIWFSKPMRS